MPPRARSPEGTSRGQGGQCGRGAAFRCGPPRARPRQRPERPRAMLAGAGGSGSGPGAGKEGEERGRERLEARGLPRRARPGR